MANTWLNKDSLYLKYGATKAASHPAGEYRFDGPLHMVEAVLDLSTVSTTAGSIIDDVTKLPKGARIEYVEVVTETAADSASDTATLNLGLVKGDRTTAIDTDGLLATYDQSRMDAAGEKNTVIVGGTDAGALIGTTLAFSGYLCADYDTEAFTAGRIRIRIGYYMP